MLLLPILPPSEPDTPQIPPLLPTSMPPSHYPLQLAHRLAQTYPVWPTQGPDLALLSQYGPLHQPNSLHSQHKHAF